MLRSERLRILITGATGFIGTALVNRLVLDDYYKVVASVRREDTTLPSTVDVRQVGDQTASTNWKKALCGVDVLIHTAARAHIMGDKHAEPLKEYRKVNVAGTLNLAQQAGKAGVKRFVFISSVGVNGIQNSQPFTEKDVPNPVEPYAVSKWEAEQGLSKIADESDMEFVVVRPPLVFGAYAPGNFGRLLRIVDKGVPLPLGAIHNKRSFVALDNLVDLILTCIEHSAAVGNVFFAGDGEDLSTTDLLTKLGRALGKSTCLLPVPQWLIESGLRLLGKGELAQKLCGSLRVDISKARYLLDWQPPVTVDEALGKMAACYSDRKRQVNLSP